MLTRTIYRGEERKKRPWLPMSSPSHVELRTIISAKQLVNDMKKMNENVYTTYLQVYHSVRVRYLQKSSFYEGEKMIADS